MAVIRYHEEDETIDADEPQRFQKIDVMRVAESQALQTLGPHLTRKGSGLPKGELQVLGNLPAEPVSKMATISDRMIRTA